MICDKCNEKTILLWVKEMLLICDKCNMKNDEYNVDAEMIGEAAYWTGTDEDIIISVSGLIIIREENAS